MSNTSGMGRPRIHEVDLQDYYDVAEKLIDNDFHHTNNDCWETGYSPLYHGYVKTRIPKTTSAARRWKGYKWMEVPTLYIHRAMWAWKHEKLPPADKIIHHNCGNFACCRPEHLEAITPEQAFQKSEIHNSTKKVCSVCGSADWMKIKRRRNGRAYVERGCRPCARARDKLSHKRARATKKKARAK